MASPRPKSPKTPVYGKTDESFWDKLGTIGRKKRIKEGMIDSRMKIPFKFMNDVTEPIFTIYGNKLEAFSTNVSLLRPFGQIKITEMNYSSLE